MWSYLKIMAVRELVNSLDWVLGTSHLVLGMEEGESYRGFRKLFP